MRKQDLEAEREALELRLGGLSYREIADRQSTTVSTAHGRVERALASLVPIDKAEQVRQMEAERLEAVGSRLLATIAMCSERDEAGRFDLDGLVKAASGYARISERKAKLLGLDVPVENRLRVTGDLDAQIEALAAELAGEGDPAEEPVPAGP